MEKLISRSASIIVLVLFLFSNQGSGAEDTGIAFPDFEGFRNTDEAVLGSTSFPLDRSIVERRVYVSAKPGDEERSARFFVDIREPEKKFRLSLSLMSMKCDATGDSSLQITADETGGGNTTDWCTTIRGISDHHTTDGYTVQGATSYEVEVVGDWSNTDAYLLATIYYEADSCSDCDSSSFCCKSDGCAPIDGYQTRCISKALKCNGFPNCGMICDNTDEERDAYFGFPCGLNIWNVFWMTSMGITFFVLIPCIIVFLFCYNRKLKQERRNRPHPDPLRRRRMNDVVVTHSPPDDLPPTYDDVHDIKEPPPNFNTVMTPNSHGVDNLAMIPDTERNSPVFHSTQSKVASTNLEKNHMGNFTEVSLN